MIIHALNMDWLDFLMTKGLPEKCFPVEIEYPLTVQVFNKHPSVRAYSLPSPLQSTSRLPSLPKDGGELEKKKCKNYI